MEGTLIAFRLARYNRDHAIELVKRLYGPRTSSHAGTCVVRRKGLLDEIAHVRLIQGVVIGRTEAARPVIDFLADLGAVVLTKRVERTKEDRTALGVWPVVSLWLAS